MHGRGRALLKRLLSELITCNKKTVAVAVFHRCVCVCGSSYCILSNVLFLCAASEPSHNSTAWCQMHENLLLDKKKKGKVITVALFTFFMTHTHTQFSKIRWNSLECKTLITSKKINKNWAKLRDSAQLSEFKVQNVPKVKINAVRFLGVLRHDILDPNNSSFPLLLPLFTLFLICNWKSIPFLFFSSIQRLNPKHQPRG